MEKVLEGDGEEHRSGGDSVLGEKTTGRRWSKLKRSGCAMESSCADSGKRNPPRNAQMHQQQEVPESQVTGEQRLPINKSIITSLLFSPFWISAGGHGQRQDPAGCTEGLPADLHRTGINWETQGPLLVVSESTKTQSCVSQPALEAVCV